jgi:pimeloyl-ACP methyl ester carboxylesterase
MSRSFLAFFVTALIGCSAAPPDATAVESGALEQSLDGAVPPGASVDAVHRDPIGGDVVHFQFDLRVGTTPNAVLRIHRVVRERSPWMPRPSSGSVMLLHGDFSTFASNFLPALASPASTAPGLARFLAERDLDVWGVDRRWTRAPAEGADFSDFGDMSFAAELDDIGRALAFARGVRVLGGSGEKMTLAGFSRGGHLAYAYAAREGGRRPAQRHVKSLAILDVYAEIAPNDQAARDTACANAEAERQALAGGTVDSDNGIFILLGSLALNAPGDPSPFFDGLTNRNAFLVIVAQTYIVFAPTPHYHLAAGIFEGDQVTGLRESAENVVESWFAGAAPHQSMREVAESDTLWCGKAPLPVAIDLSRIEVPLYYLGAAGGFGEHGLFTTTRVGSTDVTRQIVHRFGPDRDAEDFGHGDLLFAKDAPSLAWKSLATWILGH